MLDDLLLSIINKSQSILPCFYNSFRIMYLTGIRHSELSINHLSVILCVADRVKLTLHYEKEGETTYLGNLEEKRESDG